MYKKGDILYYFTMFVNGDYGYAKLQCEKDSASQISSTWKILEILGSANDFSVGEIISANQLSGPSTSGLDKYSFISPREVLRELFFILGEYDFHTI